MPEAGGRNIGAWKGGDKKKHGRQEQQRGDKIWEKTGAQKRRQYLKEMGDRSREGRQKHNRIIRETPSSAQRRHKRKDKETGARVSGR